MWETNKNSKLVSGLLVKDLPLLVNYSEKDSFKTFPYSIVLTQPCDIQSHYKVLSKVNLETYQDINRQYLSSILLCPAFDEEAFKSGIHLQTQFSVKLKVIDDKEFSDIRKNKNMRFQFLSSNDVKIPNLIIDFKHFFTVTFPFLETIYFKNTDQSFFLNHIHFMNLSDRFAHYIQRVAIPD